MDARITKKRLGHMLSYDWIKIVAIAAALIVVWSLLFTMLATRASNGQTFYLYSFYDVSMKGDKVNTLDNLKKHNALSYDILELNDYTFTDNQYLAQIMAAYFSAAQGDVLFITDYVPEAEQEKAEEGEEVYTNLQSFASSYYSILAPLKGEYTNSAGNVVKKNYFETLEGYLNQFYKGEDFREGELNIDAVKSAFRTRMKKDKRFKTEAQKKKGFEKEIARIENLRISYLRVEKALELGIISIKDTKIAEDIDKDGKISDGEWKTVNCVFDLSGISHITDYVTNSEGGKEGLCMGIFDWSSQQPDLQYEPITYLNFLLTEYERDRAGELPDSV